MEAITGVSLLVIILGIIFIILFLYFVPLGLFKSKDFPRSYWNEIKKSTAGCYC
jgi:hypothetical protein